MLVVKPFHQRLGFCGPSCLKMVLNYYGTTVTERELARLTKANTSRGTDAKHISAAAKKFGHEASIEDFATIGMISTLVNKRRIPVIVNYFFINEPHYAVVIDIDTENIYVQDPLDGTTKAMRIFDFKKIWFGFMGQWPQEKRDFAIRRIIVVYPKKSKKKSKTR